MARLDEGHSLYSRCSMTVDLGRHTPTEPSLQAGNDRVLKSRGAGDGNSQG